MTAVNSVNKNNYCVTYYSAAEFHVQNDARNDAVLFTVQCARTVGIRAFNWLLSSGGPDVAAQSPVDEI